MCSRLKQLELLELLYSVPSKSIDRVLFGANIYTEFTCLQTNEALEEFWRHNCSSNENHLLQYYNHERPPRQRLSIVSKRDNRSEKLQAKQLQREYNFANEVEHDK
jgi:hypothetical protein